MYSDLLPLYLKAAAKSEKFLPAPAFAAMLGYEHDELKELYERELTRNP